MNVQYGCGKCAPKTWQNYDISPTLKLERLPLVGKLFVRKEWGAYPKNVIIGDITVGLPDVKPETVDNVYCSHVLEHLSYEDLKRALRNTYQMLKRGGIFRLVVPDLELMVNEYVEDKKCGKKDAAHRLIDKTLMGVKNKPTGLIARMVSTFGNSHHLWNYDFSSLALELEEVGFKNIRRAEFNDSVSLAFLDVEDNGRWVYSLGIECIK